MNEQLTFPVLCQTVYLGSLAGDASYEPPFHLVLIQNAVFRSYRQRNIFLKYVVIILDLRYNINQ